MGFKSSFRVTRVAVEQEQVCLYFTVSRKSQLMLNKSAFLTGNTYKYSTRIGRMSHFVPSTVSTPRSCDRNNCMHPLSDNQKESTRLVVCLEPRPRSVGPRSRSKQKPSEHTCCTADLPTTIIRNVLEQFQCLIPDSYTAVVSIMVEVATLEKPSFPFESQDIVD